MSRKNIWFISDTHFFHSNILKFTNADGSLARPGYDSVEDMNEKLVERWNADIRPQDTVYHMGDVSFRYGSEFNELMSRLNGNKTLIIGNHDNVALLLPWFPKVLVWREFRDHNFVASHVPVHPTQLRRGKDHEGFNIHGHIHANVLEDHRYINLCVEHTGGKPVHIDEVLAKIAQRSGRVRN
jgi:calcineurin-like phosphoesterase family protein